MEIEHQALRGAPHSLRVAWVIQNKYMAKTHRTREPHPFLSPNHVTPAPATRKKTSYIAALHPGYEEGKMSRIVSSSRCPKGRLLHYFPRNAPDESSASSASSGDTDGGGDAAGGGGPETATTADDAGGGSGATAGRGGGGGGEDDGAFSDWCGWHHDHSSLTGARADEGQYMPAL